jgi:hypothetical protein
MATLDGAAAVPIERPLQLLTGEENAAMSLTRSA